MRQDLSGIWAAASEQLLTYPLTQPVRQVLVAAMYGGTEPSQVGSKEQTLQHVHTKEPSPCLWFTWPCSAILGRRIVHALSVHALSSVSPVSCTYSSLHVSRRAAAMCLDFHAPVSESILMALSAGGCWQAPRHM